jgi:hypothetical protein
MTDIVTGLTTEEVNKLKEQGLDNIPVGNQSKTIGQIIAGNVFTYFNFVFAVFAALLILVRSYINMTFLPIILLNTILGIVQEIKAKIVLDRLTVVNAPRTKVIRDSAVSEVDSVTLVKGDVCIFTAGNQLSADAILAEGCVRVNEAMVTGESDEVIKNKGYLVEDFENQCKIKKIKEEVFVDELNEDSILEIPKPILIKNLGMMFATENSKERKRFGLYKCGFCGTEFRTNTYKVNVGLVKSCGCYKKRRVSETHKTHGLRSTGLYKIWRDIKSRTLNPKNKRYSDYGGRGITICDDWKNDFMSFYNWAMSNGYSDELSIDRINNDGNYEPSNCRWTTPTIQSRNQRIRKDNTSGYKGVSYNKKLSKYVVKIQINKKRIYLGSFSTPEEGAIAYNNYIIENNLEGFNLNEIPKEIK